MYLSPYFGLCLRNASPPMQKVGDPDKRKLVLQAQRRRYRENSHVFSRSDHGAGERCRASAAVLCGSGRLHARCRLFTERRVPRPAAHSAGLKLLDTDRQRTYRLARWFTSQRLSRRHRPRGRAEPPARTWGRRRRDPAQDAHWSLGRRFRTRPRPRARRLCQLRRLLRSGWQPLGATGTGLPQPRLDQPEGGTVINRYCENPDNLLTVLGFLNHLEESRGNTIRTRNARLAALRSFVHYLTDWLGPELTAATRRILTIPFKRQVKPLIGFLTRAEIEAILAATDDTWTGRRDHLLILLLYNTGARISELLALRVQDVLGPQAKQVELQGKGRKRRTLPLWRQTQRLLRQWIRENRLTPLMPLLPNRYGEPLSLAPQR